MSDNLFKVNKGIKLKANADTLTEAGALKYNESGNLILRDGSSEKTVLDEDNSVTVINKSFDGQNNTFTNIGNSALSSGIDAAKIADGSVSNTEFQYLDGVTSSIQTQINAKADDSALTDHLNDTADAHDASAISFDNSGTGLVTSTAQLAIAETKAFADAIDGDLSTHVNATAAHGVGEVVGTTEAQDLSNKTFTDALTLQEQSGTPSTPASGDKKIYAKNDGKLYTLDDAGVETEVGSGAGGGGTFYINEDFENGVANLSAYADAAGPSPVDADGGTPTITVTAETSNPLVGNGSALITKSAANSQGEGVVILSDTVDEAYEDKVHTVEFLWKTDSNYTDGNVSLWVVNPTSGTVSALYFRTALGEYTNELPKSDTTVTRIVSELTPIDSTYKIALHIGETSSTAWLAYVDDIKAGPQRIIQTSAAGPVGEIIALGTDVTPTNFLYCDGTAVSRSVFSELFSVIGTNFGTGDGSTTFNIPDLRGEFLRGQDDGRGADLDASSRVGGDAVGSTQGDATALPNTAFTAASAGAHTHTVSIDLFNNPGTGGPREGDVDNGNDRVETTSSAGAHTHTITGGDSETRPRNVAVRYYIRYADGSQILSTTQVDHKTAKFVATRSSAQSIPDATNTTILWDDVLKNTGQFSYNAATGILTFNQTGTYIVTAGAGLISASAGTGFLRVFCDGAVQKDFGRAGIDTTSIFQSGAFVQDFAAGDTLKVDIYQNNGTSRNTESTRMNFSVVALPDFSTFGVYGAYEVVSANSAGFRLDTPGFATGEWAQMTGNSVTLGPGTWLLSGYIEARDDGANPLFNSINATWATENGDNTNSEPNAFPQDYPLNNLNGNQYIFDLADQTTGGINVPNAIITLAESDTIFLNARVFFSTAADGVVSSNILARRLK